MKSKVTLIICAICACFILAACASLFEDLPADEGQKTQAADDTLVSTAPVPPDMGLEVLPPFPYDFTATDLYGQPVDAASLGEYKVYFVHLWGTWCPPCLAEMPDIGAVQAEYGDRVGFLALVDDYESNTSGAIKIVEAAGITDSFIMVNAYEPSVAAILAHLQTGYVPTTVFVVDGEVTEPLVGAYGPVYADVLDMLLE